VFKYCLDTSGFSNPLQVMPEDIYCTLWSTVRERIEAGTLCLNKEIADEIRDADLGPYVEYIEHFERMRVEHEAYISEYNGNRKNTVGLADVSIIALAKTLGLPLVNMEAPNRNEPSEKRIRIPDLCQLEAVTPFTFNDFLRAEGISL